MEHVVSELETRFWRIFKRVLAVDECDSYVSKDTLEEWDSLKHVELMFELEEKFELDITPDDIVALYSDSNIVLDYLKSNVSG